MSTTRAPCPQCDRGPRDRALAVTSDERGTVSHCHRCQWWRSEWTSRCRQCDSIVNMVSDASGTTGTCTGCGRDADKAPVTHELQLAGKPCYSGNKVNNRQPLDWSSVAESIWRRTRAIRGTIGETYLRHRGCLLPPRDSHVRFLPATDRHAPALCAAITDIITGKPISLHFTRLAADGRGKAGSERDKSLLSGHRKRGGCIRLWANESVTHGLGLAEGIETGLAAAHGFTPTWAAIDAGNMASFPVLAGIETLTVFADHDDAGLKAAAACGHRWVDAGREVVIVTPDEPGLDIADIAA